MPASALLGWRQLRLLPRSLLPVAGCFHAAAQVCLPRRAARDGERQRRLLNAADVMDVLLGRLEVREMRTTEGFNKLTCGLF